MFKIQGAVGLVVIPEGESAEGERMNMEGEQDSVKLNKINGFFKDCVLKRPVI